MTPAERYQCDPIFAQLVKMFLYHFNTCDANGAGLTPTEIREASALAWQIYAERNANPILIWNHND